MPPVETMNNQQARPSILSFAKDLPNICSLMGLLSALLAIYFAFLSLYPAAMIALIVAVFLDWTDGIIARKMQGRTKEQSQFGAQLDSLIDIVSFGICPAILLLSYGDFSPWFFPGAFIIVAAGVLRLSYFNVFGLDGESSYQGMAIDNNAIILVFLFLFDGLLEPGLFIYLLYGSIIAIAFLNVAPIRTPKLSGAWYYVLIAYTIIISIIYTWKIMSTSV
ncbi:CDP-alcohol phosphatidyltransferase family protein [Shewanella sp.]|uniref:CDP-alcohol phosphatidyltransferase family protein n=1 Tax=Shewanella sp. TaxID=50422 RepID=UPI001EC419F1|nr:CDP-alcohol phosphatidyltransferase family protein [Shewanella sp.]NRB23293.1 CDP-alcohol phosphatidyltransferase family protein [Shewanella sp.]